MLRIIGIAFAAATLATTGASAQDVKVGVVLPLTGGLAPVGKQVQAGIKAYMDKNGVAGKKIDLIIKDDAGVPDNSKRLAQLLPCMRVLGKLEQIVDPQRKAHA